MLVASDSAQIVSLLGYAAPKRTGSMHYAMANLSNTILGTSLDSCYSSDTYVRLFMCAGVLNV